MINQNLTGCRERGFIIWPNGKMPLCDGQYYRECTRRRVPYVRLTSRQKVAHAMIDFQAADRIALDETFRCEVQTFLRELGFQTVPEFRTINMEAQDCPIKSGQQLARFFHGFAHRFAAAHGITPDER